MAVDCGEPADPLFRDAVGGGEECAEDGSTAAVVATPVTSTNSSKTITFPGLTSSSKPRCMASTAAQF
jgi:hypothetical protein